MGIAVLVVTDGRRDYLARTVASLLDQVTGPVTEWWMYDDTGGDAYRARLEAEYPKFRHFNAGRRQGFGGAIAAAWRRMAVDSAAQWVFHVEQDFEFRRPVDLADLAAVLSDRPYLVQMALRRQPWNDAEHVAGGVVEMNPNAYVERVDDTGRRWLEHRLFLTTNPSLYRRSLCWFDWPAGCSSEGRFTHRLLTDGAFGVPGEAVRFGYWGARDSGVWVEHIGHQRAGTGY